MRWLAFGVLFVAATASAEPALELQVRRPDGAGPFPAVVVVHGHSRERRGAADVSGLMDAMVKKGWVAVAVSLPGYGKSPGEPDYCGPRSQDAVLAAVRHARAQKGVDGKRVALYGMSRGAVTAAMAAARDPQLAALVLVTPIYDLENTYKRMRTQGSTDAAARGVADAIAAEAGTTTAAFAARSPLAVADKIKAPTLILAGGKDVRIDPDEPYELAHAIKGGGTAVIFADLAHTIPDDMRDARVFQFLDEKLARQRP